VVDAPGGGGKIALIPDPVVSFDDEEIQLKNYEGLGVPHYVVTPTAIQAPPSTMRIGRILEPV
jgi:hypothetical protein